MVPSDLTAAAFSSYPPRARELASANVQVMRQLPLAFIPLLLREVINYDWKFPAEAEELDHQFEFLKSRSPADLKILLSGFAELKLPDNLATVDWVNIPAEFSEQLSSHLWASGQIEAFRKASILYVHELNKDKPQANAPVRRLTVASIGQGGTASPATLFRRLRPQGTLLTNASFSQEAIVDLLASRSKANPKNYAHWWIDGAEVSSVVPGCTTVSYAALQPVCVALVAKMTASMQPGGGGPERLRSSLQRMRPDELGFGKGGDPILDRFQLELLTEGSGTQLFSTTFVQWAAREALRRAQPRTLLARFTPRRRAGAVGPESIRSSEMDAAGALVDADMGAYYTWINQQRLQGAETAGFVAWYEGHSAAVVVGPGFKAGREESKPMSLAEVAARLAS